MTTERTIKVGDVTITVAQPTNRQREYLRRIVTSLRGTFSDQTVAEYAACCAYTVKVEGGWQPPAPTAGKEAHLRGIEEFLDLPSALTDRWQIAIFDEVDPVTSPQALPKDADPNS